MKRDIKLCGWYQKWVLMYEWDLKMWQSQIPNKEIMLNKWDNLKQKLMQIERNKWNNSDLKIEINS